MMEQGYTALRTIGTIYKILGAITMLATVLVVLISGGFFRGGVLGGFLALIGGAAIALTLYAAGEGVFLLLALEENTRLTATLLQRQAGAAIQTYPIATAAPQPSYAAPSPTAGPVLNTKPIGRGGQVQPRE
jgi:hypothetical protein